MSFSHTPFLPPLSSPGRPPSDFRYFRPRARWIVFLAAEVDDQGFGLARTNATPSRTEGHDDAVGVLRVGGEGADLIPTDPGHTIECFRGLCSGLDQPESVLAAEPEAAEAVAGERGRGLWRLGEVDPGELPGAGVYARRPASVASRSVSSDQGIASSMRSAFPPSGSRPGSVGVSPPAHRGPGARGCRVTRSSNSHGGPFVLRGPGGRAFPPAASRATVSHRPFSNRFRFAERGVPERAVGRDERRRRVQRRRLPADPFGLSVDPAGRGPRPGTHAGPAHGVDRPAGTHEHAGLVPGLRVLLELRGVVGRVDLEGRRERSDFPALRRQPPGGTSSSSPQRKRSLPTCSSPRRCSTRRAGRGERCGVAFVPSRSTYPSPTVART